MALYDLEDFKVNLSSSKKADLTLSDLPVIIYQNNKPKYYEFIVSNNKKENIGTITCFAKKEAPDFTAYILPYVRDYKDRNATIYSDFYPNSSQNIANLYSKGVSASTPVTSPESSELKDEAKDFWNMIDNKEYTIEKAPRKNLSGRFIDAWNEYYTIPEFDNDALKRTHFSGDCGPAALAWLYRAYHPTYKGVYYPLHGETNSFNDFIRYSDYSYYRTKNKNVPLFNDLAKICRVDEGIIKGATLPDDLKNAVNTIFPNHKLEGGIAISIGKARKSIEANNPTVLLIRHGKELHYVAGFGTKNRYNTYKLWFIKVKKVHTDSWIYVSDNGSTTQDNGYLPYYMNTHAILGKDFVTFKLLRK